MTKAELIAYLDAVCAAESAVDACVSSMKMLHNQINALHEPDKPEYIPQYDNFPVKEEVDREDFGPIHESELFDSRSITDARKDAIATGIGVGIATYVALCMILYVIARLSSPEPNYNIAVSSLVIGAIVFVITAIIQYPKEVRERKEEAIAAVKEADQRYEDHRQ